MKHLHILRVSLYLFGFFGFLIRITETVYVYFFNKPIFVHFYLRKRKLSKLQKHVLVDKVDFYKSLDKKRKTYFEHRLAVFIRKHQFIGRDGYTTSAETKVLIGAVYIMMTFGMRKYTTTIFEKIIVYPNPFLSRVTGKKHKGEFNPKFKIIVFSWSDFIKGVETKDDNLHLGVHEFAHVLSFHILKSKDFSAKLYHSYHKKVLKIFKDKNELLKLKNLEFFRNYGFTNKLEFMAVLLECFFETPLELKQKSPKLFNHVVKMLNFDDYVKI